MENWEASEEANTDFVCLSDEEGLSHIDSFLKSNEQQITLGTHGFADFDAKRLLLLNRVFIVRTDQTGQYLDMNLT